jgi:hypothetical protein
MGVTWPGVPGAEDARMPSTPEAVIPEEEPVTPGKSVRGDDNICAETPADKEPSLLKLEGKRRCEAAGCATMFVVSEARGISDIVEKDDDVGGG